MDHKQENQNEEQINTDPPKLGEPKLNNLIPNLS